MKASILKISQIDNFGDGVFTLKDVDAHSFHIFVLPFSDVAVSITKDADTKIVLDRNIALSYFPVHVLSLLFDPGVLLSRDIHLSFMKRKVSIYS